MAVQQPPIPAFGVTGGIGSGKSAVCTILKRMEVPVLSADLIARDLSVADSVVRRKIIALLGPSAYRSDGSYDRPFVAERVFSDSTIQHKLESIVHPAVERALFERLASLKAAGRAFAAVEAALVFEAGMDRWLRAVVVVEAPEQLRIERVMTRDGVDAASVLRRMRAQLSAAEIRKRADIVIENDGSPAELEPRVHFALTILRTLMKKG